MWKLGIKVSQLKWKAVTNKQKVSRGLGQLRLSMTRLKEDEVDRMSEPYPTDTVDAPMCP